MSRLKVVMSAFLGRWFLRAVFFLNRQTVLNGQRWGEVLSTGRPVLICCWHGRLLFPVFRWWREGSHALAGLHEDAEIISRIATKLGWSMMRGSSSRGGRQAYRQLLQALEEKGRVFIGRSPRSGVRGEGRFCEKRRPDECDPSPRIGTVIKAVGDQKLGHICGAKTVRPCGQCIR